MSAEATFFSLAEEYEDFQSKPLKSRRKAPASSPRSRKGAAPPATEEDSVSSSAACRQRFESGARSESRPSVRTTPIALQRASHYPAHAVRTHDAGRLRAAFAAHSPAMRYPGSRCLPAQFETHDATLHCASPGQGSARATSPRLSHCAPASDLAALPSSLTQRSTGLSADQHFGWEEEDSKPKAPKRKRKCSSAVGSDSD
ncbi:unnamed protein product [Boreogadus saida]